jgi:HK97 family phage major capsid protein
MKEKTQTGLLQAQESLERRIEALLHGGIVKGMFFAATATSIPELEDQLIAMEQRVITLQAAIDSEDRGCTPEEEALRTELMNGFDALEKELQARRRMESQQARLQDSAGRLVVGEAPGDAIEGLPQNGPAPVAPKKCGNSVTAERVEVKKQLLFGTGGFKNFGEYALAIFNSNPHTGGLVDRRLLPLKNASLTGDYGNEGVNTDGGYSVPPDFRAEIVKKIFSEASLVSMTDQQTTTSRAMTFPVDDSTPWQATGGIRFNWLGEAEQITRSKPQLTLSEVKLEKIATLVPITEELLEDAPAIGSYLSSKVPEVLGFAMNDALINGTGAGQPLGILESPALRTIDAEAGQTAGTVNFDNIIKMRGSMYPHGKNKAVWLATPQIEEQLMKLTFPSSVNTIPVYLPPNGLSATPYGTLLGRPVITTEACAEIGNPGDLIFADLSQYMTLTRRGTGLRTDVSIHIFFEYDVSSFRFILRFGGKPWWNNPMPGKGAAIYSPFVVLAERA